MYFIEILYIYIYIYIYIDRAIFSRKTDKIAHPPLYFNNTAVKLTHTQKNLSLHLDSKLLFNEHINNKKSEAIKGIALLRKLLFYHAGAY